MRKKVGGCLISGKRLHGTLRYSIWCSK